VRESPDNHRRNLDGCTDSELAATPREAFKVQVKYAPEQVRQTHARRRAVRVNQPIDMQPSIEG